MCKKLQTLCALVLLTCMHVNAQEEYTLKPGQLKANISIPGLSASYELRLFPYSTLNLEAGIVMAVGYSDLKYDGFRWLYAALPVFSGEVRQYYGLSRRAAKGKHMNNNAGNFFSLTGGVRAAPVFSKNFYVQDERSYGFIIPAWGMQRSWGKHISFEARFGWIFKPVYYYMEAKNAPSVRLNFGYVIR